MFSFRTTGIEEQLDKGLTEGRVGVFCTQNCWNPTTGKYLYELFSDRGNLAKVFIPQEAELSSEESHIEFDIDEIKGLNAIVAEIQDNGTRYCCHTIDLLRLMSALNTLDEAPSLYIIDHPNPAGRTVEGTLPAVDRDIWTPLVAHRHGLTVGELCHLYYNETGARYPLHIISAKCSQYGKTVMPWTIAPSAEISGIFSAFMCPGGEFWRGSSITPGIGTPRAYEYIGAPFIKHESTEKLPKPEGVKMRPCTFTPSYGQYEGEKCFGYQIIIGPGTEYHSILHTLELMRYFLERYSQFTLGEEVFARISDPVIEAFLKQEIPFDIVQEHIKSEEQKWIRKAKRFALYDDAPYRIK